MACKYAYNYGDDVTCHHPHHNEISLYHWVNCIGPEKQEECELYEEEEDE